MIPRHALSTLEDDLSSYPAVALLGPRQSGKTTLAMEIGGAMNEGPERQGRVSPGRAAMGSVSILSSRL